ncbi:MAG: acyl-CoA thioesterase [Calditrichaceae bacterium]
MIEHSSQLRVRYAETDQMKFVHHSNYIVWFEFGRTELLKAYGFSYAGLEKDGYLMPVLEVNARYLKPAKYDDLITIKTTIPFVPKARIGFEYQVFNEGNQLLCEGSSLHSFMNNGERAIKPPKNFLIKMKNYFEG